MKPSVTYPCVLVLLAASLVVPVVATAEPIYLTSLRLIRADAGSERVEVVAPDNGFFEVSRTVFHDDALAAAFQSSLLGPAGISAEGSARTVQGLTTGAFAVSSLLVNFAVDTPHQYTIEGFLTGRFFPNRPSVYLYSAQADRDVFSALTPGAFAGNGLLRPGRYQLGITVQSDATLDPSATFETSLRLTEGAPVPEPGTLLLIGTGGLWCLRRARRRRAARTPQPCFRGS